MANEQEKELSYDELKALYAQSLKSNEESTQLIGELTQALDTATAGAALSTAVVVSHEGKKYQVLAPKFQHSGTTYEAAALGDHPKVVKELVAAIRPDDHGLLKPLEEPAAEETVAPAAKPAATTKKTASK